MYFAETPEAAVAAAQKSFVAVQELGALSILFFLSHRFSSSLIAIRSSEHW